MPFHLMVSYTDHHRCQSLNIDRVSVMVRAEKVVIFCPLRMQLYVDSQYTTKEYYCKRRDRAYGNKYSYKRY